MFYVAYSIFGSGIMVARIADSQNVFSLLGIKSIEALAESMPNAIVWEGE
jgi:hypothetical protein